MHIFISYAKADTFSLAIQLRDQLRQLPNVTVWMDETLEPGESWATQIQEEIDAADYLIVLLSPDVNRPISGKQNRSFVLNEIDYAQQEGKVIIPVMAQKTRIPVQLAGVQYINFANDQAAAMNRLIRRIAPITGIPAAAVPPTPPMGVEIAKASLPEIAKKHVTATSPKVKRPLYSRVAVYLPAIALVAIVAIILISIAANSMNTTPPTRVAVEPSNSPPPIQPTVTDTPTITPTSGPTLTPTPTLRIGFVVQTLDANATLEQASLNDDATIAVRATGYAVGTETFRDQTATATLWTATLTPNVTASIEAYRTEQAQTVTAQFFEGLTATATLWTATPTSTFTPSLTPTPSSTPTETLTPIPTSTLTPTPVPIGFSGNPVVHNADWTPQVQTFNDYEMMLVPVGCFMMGQDSNFDTKPVNQQCFDQPFWIDHYEVTNKQFGSFGLYSGDTRPRERVSWSQARDFCAAREARLPTEREWEYAARGPDNLLYPWGNDFLTDNTVYLVNSNNQSAPVGSRPAGNSWVGASDLSGNVWEWVSSAYKPYPYALDDGREDATGSLSGVSRVTRGGSFDFYLDKMTTVVRKQDVPSTRNYNIGFRCARDY